MNIGKEDGLIGSNEIEVIAEENEADLSTTKKTNTYLQSKILEIMNQ